MPTFKFVDGNVVSHTASHDDNELAAAQLDEQLQDAVTRALSSGRPILTHLNADTTWLLSLSYPPGSKLCPGRSRFNILIDPWLEGPQSDVASWFSTQWHAIESSVQTIDELNSLLTTLESPQLRSEHSNVSKANGKGSSDALAPSPRSLIDAVIISHEFTDHCHEATLKQVERDVPVFATTKAAELIRSWRHFENVHDVPVFNAESDWRKLSAASLPQWLSFGRLVTKSDALYYHSAVIVCIQDPTSEEGAEAVIYTPHGVEPCSFATISSASPPIRTLAFLHGLHDVSITLTKQLNLGAHNALKAQRILNARYWVGTHDEVKRGGGLVSFFLRRKQHTVDEALSKESRRKNIRKTFGDEGSAAPDFSELRSGESLLLE